MMSYVLYLVLETCRCVLGERRQLHSSAECVTNKTNTKCLPFCKFGPNLLNGGIHKDTTIAKLSLLRWPCPLPSDRTIPVLWQNLDPKSYAQSPTVKVPLSSLRSWWLSCTDVAKVARRRQAVDQTRGRGHFFGLLS